jgi:hypothetical protein
MDRKLIATQMCCRKNKRQQQHLEQVIVGFSKCSQSPEQATKTSENIKISIQEMFVLSF